MTNFDLYFGNMTYFWQIWIILHYFFIGLILTYFLTNMTNFDLFFRQIWTNFDLFFDKYVTNFDLLFDKYG